MKTRYYHRQDGKVTISTRIGNHTYTKTVSRKEYEEQQSKVIKLALKMTFFFIMAIVVLFCWVTKGAGLGIFMIAYTTGSYWLIKKMYGFLKNKTWAALLGKKKV
ncbi:hypothetical protein [Neobacillus cucumis]|uniref:hypothetical protein n=1 Tax=Neobacillus cucumis TaxID=1740721 RepID=UPI002E1C48AC|nr:hypothetical protein [Neobacillus cucumis]